MADARAVFAAEFGDYFDAVSPENPVGVCTRCLLLRTRQDVDNSEKCPASLADDPNDITEAEPHAWRRFTDRDQLEAYVKENIGTYQAVVNAAAELVVIADADPGQDS